MTWFSQQTVIERSPHHSSSHRRPHTKSSSRMSLDTLATDTNCSKGHTHPPWPTSGLLRIAKCESVCGFCHKETKTAANLRKHVAIHIKNEGMNLQIAEGSSGRGRLEMPVAQSDRGNSSSASGSSRLSQVYDEDDNMSTTLNTNYSYNNKHPTDPFSPSAVLMSMSSRPSYTSYSQPSYSSPSTPQPSSFSPPPLPPPATPHTGSFYDVSRDPFKTLREHNMSTKSAWTVIPAAEGARILDYCKSMSVAQHDRSGRNHVPCYNRETIFDEEWQAHMKDVHGVFLIWPATWMRRIEVLDLDVFGGDIGACNGIIMGRES